MILLHKANIYNQVNELEIKLTKLIKRKVKRNRLGDLVGEWGSKERREVEDLAREAFYEGKIDYKDIRDIVFYFDVRLDIIWEAHKGF